MASTRAFVPSSSSADIHIKAEPVEADEAELSDIDGDIDGNDEDHLAEQELEPTQFVVAEQTMEEGEPMDTPTDTPTETGNGPQIAGVTSIPRPQLHKCQECPYTASEPSLVSRHMSEAHAPIRGSSWICSECDYRSDSRRKYLLHYERKHLKTKVFACDICDFFHKDLLRRNRHLEVEHSVCSSCDFRGHSRHDVDAHMDVIHPKRIYNCCHCDFESATQNSLDLHVLNEHLNRQSFHFRCKLCPDFTTTVSYDLHEHKMKVHGVKELTCETCDYKTRLAWQMADHELTHSKMGYACDQCDYKTNRIMFLNRHKKARHGEKNFRCSQCDFKSAQRWCVKQHIIQVHEKIKMFACTHCDYRASSRGNLNVHLRGVHYKEKKFACDKCDFKTCLKGGLIKHLKSHRGMDIKCDSCTFTSNSRGTMALHKRDCHSL